MKVFLASDSDDIGAGVDLIVTCIEASTGKEIIIGVDLATSQNATYLDGKGGRNRCTPKEFLLTQGKPQNTEVPRVVYAISPDKMAKIAQEVLRDIGEGKPVNTRTIGQKYSGSGEIIDTMGYGIDGLIHKIQIRTNLLQTGT